MSQEILINVTPIETRVALVDNGLLQDVYIERERNRNIVGNLYWGKVVRVLPGMQAAFVDIGLEKAGYIHLSDLSDEESKNEDIASVLKEGQKLLVKILKAPIGTKGARLSSFLSVSSRHLVFMPQTSHRGISNKIENAGLADDLIKGLDKLLVEFKDELPILADGGFIIRTAADELATAEELITDLRYLNRLWAALQKKIETQPVPSLIFDELNLGERIVRDHVYLDVERIRVDDEYVYERVKKFAAEFIPELESRVELYINERPIFDLFSIEEDLSRALSRKVDLKSNGYIIFDQTEALTTIDVNTGGFVGKNNLEETIYKTNLEAASALARQLRLRNLGGIIIVDFIDMQSEEHRQQVLKNLKKALASDKSKIYVGSFSRLGLVEMTRNRTRESLEQVLCEECSVCHNRGTLRSPETICSEIFREVIRAVKTYGKGDLMITGSANVVERLLDEESSAVAELEDRLETSFRFNVETTYTQEQFDVVFL